MSRKQSYSLIILAIWLGFFLRVHNLDVVPLRGDEAFSALNWAQMPIDQSLSEIATIEPHPPLTYVIFHIWNLAIGGIESPFALRMLGVFGNLIGIPAMFALVLLMSRQRHLAILASFMWATHPFEIWHSQDFRNYALWAGLSVITLWLGLMVGRYRRTIDWVLYGVFALVTAFTFYTELLLLGALGLFMLMMHYHHRGFIIKFIGLQACIVITVLVSFFVLQGDLLGGGGYGGNVEPFSAPDYLTRFVLTLVLGDTIPLELTGLWIVLSITLIVGCVVLWKVQRSHALFALFMIVIPLGLLGIASTRISIFHPRYVLATVPAFIFLLIMSAYAVSYYIRKFVPIPRLSLVLLMLSPWFIISALTVQNYYTNSTLSKSVAWDELGGFLNGNVTNDDLVIQLSVDPAFGYYYSGSVADISLPASPTQPTNEIITILQDAQANYDSLYIVSNAIPDWQNANVVETWANENMQLVLLSNASGLGIRQYMNWSVDESQLTDSLTQFDDAIELVDFRLFDEPIPTGEFVLWLYWRPISRTGTSLKSFVHLAGDINPATGNLLWAQDDQFPQDGRLDSTLWDTGAIYRDVYYLSADSLIAGDYQILVGWYDPETNLRLMTDFDTDSYALTSLTIP